MMRKSAAERSIKNIRIVMVLTGFGVASCATQNYTYYLVDPEPAKDEPLQDEEGTLAQPFAWGSTTVMKVRWNDGDLLTEVDIPMVSTGQRVVIEHGTTGSGVKTLPSTRLVPPPPTPADATLIEAYRQRGLSINESAPEVSILKARERVQEASKAGNYQLALEYVELVLARYKSHPEFLRAKASLLLMMGERPKAIEIYELAESIESDPAVRKKLEELRASER
jgi:hypothetical protein